MIVKDKNGFDRNLEKKFCIQYGWGFDRTDKSKVEYWTHFKAYKTKESRNDAMKDLCRWGNWMKIYRENGLYARVHFLHYKMVSANYDI